MLAVELLVALQGTELGPRTPTGTGDTHPGRRGDPAPGQPDAQADPYDARAQR